ncbi:hypothetical protein LTR84_001801 [Exophiala bonariae]|uniref:CorA-like transporter domain-containing protein n=1 Tax=Exophiala bonariae TaxID=1690606 RepID=A0AAV9NFD4_9EURO|nr:hypothetical protein LTR84_001801 [Exophiala bonariae]
MTGYWRSAKGRGRVFRNQGTVDDRLWDSLQIDLFLEPSDVLSQAEAYSAELLVDVGEAIVQHQKSRAENVDLARATARSSAQNEHLDEHLGGILDEKNIAQFVALKTVQDIADYLNQTQKFRVFFVRQKYSWGPLLITSHLFDYLVGRTHMSPLVKSFILHFGVREREVEISPPALRFVQLSSDHQGSENCHECVYGLRFMERNGRSDSEKLSRGWSFRQAAISCRYDPLEDGVSWILITVSKHMEQQLNTVVNDKEFIKQSDPIETHYLLIASAISSWRQYLIDLSAETDAHYAQLLGTSPSDEGPIDLHESGRRQELLILDQNFLNAQLATSATAETLCALLSAWESTTETSRLHTNYSKLIRTSFKDQERELRLILLQIDNLRNKLAGITNLLSSFLDLSSGYSLQNLVKESGKENEEMRKLSERMRELAEESTQDAAAVKVLTILTLIYLPVTVVSNFFSTSFVNTTNSQGGEGGITVSGDWWILAAVSIPLTLFTLYIWLVWTRVKINHCNRPWWQYAVGIGLFRGPSKLAAQANMLERRSVGGVGPLANRGGMNEEYAPGMLPRASSELC